MITRTDFEKEKEAILSIKKEDILSPNIPINIFIDEATRLHLCSNRDRDKLINENLDPDLIDSIPSRANALRYLQSLWMKDYDIYKERNEEWIKLKEQGKNLRSVMIHYFKYAYRDNKSIINNVKRIIKSNSNASIIQDLHDLAIIGKEYPNELLKTTFNIDDLDKSINLSIKMGESMAKSKIYSKHSTNSKIIRDRAYTHLKIATDEIRRVGKFTFWRNPEIVHDYASKYFAK